MSILPPPELPLALLACFFLSAFTQSVPVVAFGLFLNEDIKMSFEEQARFYALTFIPWSLKPLYSLVIEHFGPRHRPKFAFVFSIGSACSLLLIAGFVQTVPEMYIATFLRSLCEAVAQYALNLSLIDFVVQHKDSGANDLAAYAQSRATSSRMFGSLIAFCLCLLFLYGCGGNTLPAEKTPREVIAFSSLFAFATACSACFLSRADLLRNQPHGQQQLLSTEAQKDELLTAGQQPPRRTWRIYSGIILFQSFFVWIGIYSLLPFALWITVFVLYVLGFLAIAWYNYTRENTPGGNLQQQHTSFSSGLFLFMLNACPDTSDVWFGFKIYALKNSACSMQILLVVSELASLAACWSYPRFIARFFPVREGSTPKHRAFFFVAMFTLATSVMALCTDFVLAVRWEDFGRSDMELGTNLAIFSLATVALTFVGQVQMLAEQIFITENCVHDQVSPGSSLSLTPGMWYGIFLSLLEFGGSASGWISAPIIGALNLSYMDANYADLWILVLISLLSPIGIVLGFDKYFVWTKKREQEKEEEEEQELEFGQE